MNTILAMMSYLEVIDIELLRLVHINFKKSLILHVQYYEGNRVCGNHVVSFLSLIA